MDNFQFNICSMTNEAFVRTLRLAFELSGHKNITHYHIKDNNDLAFFWSKPESNILAQPLPYPMGIGAAVSFATNWLETADYDDEPEHDGDNSRGWTIYNEGWSQVRGSFYGIIAIKTSWAIHGK